MSKFIEILVIFEFGKNIINSNNNNNKKIVKI